MFDLTRLRLRRTPIIIVTLAALVVVLASLVVPRFVTGLGIGVLPLTLLAFFALVTLFLLPVHVLPAVALVTFALVPARILPQEGPLGALPLTTMIIVVWALRRLLPTRSDSQPLATPSQPFRSATRYFALLFLAWTLFSLARSTDLQASLGWMISFSAAVLLPLTIGSATREAYWVRRSWLVLGAWLGAYAAIEGMLRFNPIWGTVFTALGLSDHQHWSVYRADAGFGHPLFAGLFFAVACALAVGIWLRENSRSALAAAVFSGLGLVATVSRGAILSAAIAVGFAYLVSLVLRGEKRWGKFALLAVLLAVAIVALFQFDSFTARNDSIEAELSSQARDLGVWVSLQAANFTGWIGSGPGTSGITGRLFNEVTIENSLLQLLISIGLPGLALFLLMIGSAVAHAVSRRAVGAAAALVAYTVCIAGFNAIDALRPMHMLLGCLLILALNPTLGPPRAAADLPLETSRASRAGRASVRPKRGYARL
jgi:O-antigen ligase